MRKNSLIVAFGILIVILGIVFLGGNHADAALTKTPTNLQADDKGVLQITITASATSMSIYPIVKYVNGVKTEGCFDTGSGFILIENGTGRKEFASFSSKSCDSNNNTTLSGLRRGLSPTSASFAAGTGLGWDAGSSVRVVDYPLIYNNSLYKDVVNTLTGSGQVASSSTGVAVINLNSVTTTQRDAFTYSNDGDVIYNTTVGAAQYKAGGAWYSFGSGGTVNATTTVKGVGEVATVSDLSGSVVTGDSGAPTWIGIDLVIRGSSGAVNNRNKVVATNNTGYLSGSLLPDLSDNITKFNGGTSASSSTYWRGDGTWVDPSTALSPLVYASSSGSINISGDTNEHDFTRSVSAPMSWTLTGSTVSTGTIIVIRASGQFSNPSGGANPVIRAKIGSTTIGAVTLGPPSTATYYFDIETTITVQAVGANGKTRASTRATGNLSTVVVMDSQHDSGINFTSDNVIKLSGQLGSASSNIVMLHGLQVYKYTPPYTN